MSKYSYDIGTHYQNILGLIRENGIPIQKRVIGNASEQYWAKVGGYRICVHKTDFRGAYYNIELHKLKKVFFMKDYVSATVLGQMAADFIQLYIHQQRRVKAQKNLLRAMDGLTAELRRRDAQIVAQKMNQR